MKITLYNMDVLKGLSQISDNSIDCIVTSPPYYSMRNYDYVTETIWDENKNCEHIWVEHKEPARGGIAESSIVGSNRNAEANNRGHPTISAFCQNCSAWKGQLGLEPNYNLYLNHLLQITQELKRILKSNGTLWWNIADTFVSSGGPSRHKGYPDAKAPNQRKGDFDEPASLPQGIKPKSQFGIPERLMLKMIDEQEWIRRNAIIWWKPNHQPESVKDRLTKSYEFIYLFTKTEEYYFNLDKIREKYNSPINRWGGEKLQAKGRSLWDNNTGQKTYRDRELRPNKEGKNPSDVWYQDGDVWDINTEPVMEAHAAKFPRKLVSRILDAGCPENGIVLDPFVGSGTTLIEAKEKYLNGIGIELNSKYCEVIKRRLNWGSDIRGTEWEFKTDNLIEVKGLIG